MFRQKHFIDNVIDRLENCLKDMGNALQVYRRKNQPKMDISKSKVKDNKISSANAKQQDTSPQRINPKPMMKQAQSQLKALPKYVHLDPNQPNPDNMTQEQKDQLRKKLLKDKPKPPINAFICYVKAQKERIKQHSPKNLSIAEVTAIASQEWKNLPAEVKRPYIQEFQQYHVSYISKRDQFIKDNPIISKIGFRKQKPRSEKIKAEDIKIQSGQSQIEQSSEISSSGSQNVQRVPQIKYRYEQNENIMQKKIAELMSKPQQRISIESYEQRKQQQDPKSKKTIPQSPSLLPYSKPQLSMIKVPSIQSPQAQKNKMTSSTKNEAKQKILSMLQARKNQMLQNKSYISTSTSNLSSNMNMNMNINMNMNANQGRKMENNRIGMMRQVIKQETQISSDSVQELSN